MPWPARLLFLFKKALCVQCRHAAGSCTGNGLAVDVVLHIAGGKDAGHTGLGGKALETALSDDVATRHVKLTVENAGVG
jgi:hypothetical protein